jgi:hypothetical protein
MHRKKIHISSVLAGQTLGIKKVDDGIWLVSFMDYDLLLHRARATDLATARQPLRPKGCHRYHRYESIAIPRPALFWHDKRSCSTALSGQSPCP